MNKTAAKAKCKTLKKPLKATASEKSCDTATLKKSFNTNPTYQHIKSFTDGLSKQTLVTARNHMRSLMCLIVCSLCSGTNMMPLVALMLTVALGCGRVQDSFHAEKHVGKQVFGQFFSDVVGGNKSRACLFPDVKDIGNKTAFRQTHSETNEEDDYCEIPRVHSSGDKPVPLIGTCGICCTVFSGLFNGVGSDDQINLHQHLI